MAHSLIALLAPNGWLLIVGVVVDLVVGDPVYAWHPIRLVGRLLTWMEECLRATGFDGYGGGVLLFAGLSTVSLSVVAFGLAAAGGIATPVASLVHVFLIYSLLALGDLLHHVWRIERAVRSGDLKRARHAVSALVGRDTDRMDEAACRRAAVESLSENLTDGFVSPVCWYVVAGVPGLVLFKVVSTMDSMVGYKTARHLRFGWCGARLDDVMNYVPARLTWLIIAALGTLLPGYSGRKAWNVGWRQHGLLLGPNSGWSEAATAGAIERRLVGPIWLKGVQVTDLWIGDPADPPLGRGNDVTRAIVVTLLAGIVASGIAAIALLSVS